MLEVAGVWVSKGELVKRLKFRVIRNGTVLQDDLKVHSFRKLKENITHADKGMEVGLTFENFAHHPFQVDDIIECYKDKPLKESVAFSPKPGVFMEY